MTTIYLWLMLSVASESKQAFTGTLLQGGVGYPQDQLQVH
jgi:hypothetical protein